MNFTQEETGNNDVTVSIKPLAESLTRQLFDETIWNEYHPYSTPKNVMGEVKERLGASRILEVQDTERDIEILYADTGKPDKPTLIYDSTTGVFLADSVNAVIDRKNEEYDIEHARFEAIARRLNHELGDFEEWGDRKRTDVIDYMLTSAL